MTDFYVEIVEMETGKVESRMGPMSERKADRVEMGALRNLNTDSFFVRTVEAEPAPAPTEGE